MSWTTTVTDGYAVGGLEFIRDYRKRCRSDYEWMEAEIKGISECGNPLWEVYYIESGIGVAKVRIRRSLRPAIHQILGVPQSERLEGKTLCAYYKDKTLMGFTPLVDVRSL